MLRSIRSIVILESSSTNMHLDKQEDGVGNLNIVFHAIVFYKRLKVVCSSMVLAVEKHYLAKIK